MNFSNLKMAKIGIFANFSIFTQFRIIIKSEPGQTSKIPAVKFRSTSNNVIYAKRIVLELNRFYSGHFKNTPNIRTIFGYATYPIFNYKISTSKLGFCLSQET